MQRAFDEMPERSLGLILETRPHFFISYPQGALGRICAMLMPVDLSKAGGLAIARKRRAARLYAGDGGDDGLKPELACFAHGRVRPWSREREAAHAGAPMAHLQGRTCCRLKPFR